MSCSSSAACVARRSSLVCFLLRLLGSASSKAPQACALFPRTAFSCLLYLLVIPFFHSIRILFLCRLLAPRVARREMRHTDGDSPSDAIKEGSDCMINILSRGTGARGGG